jgi:DNA-directed RNA polymerase subunit H (RpoH/RPB5)
MPNQKTQTVCIQMLQARGYTSIVENPEHIEAVNKKNQIVRVYILSEPKLNIDTIKYYYTMFKEQRIKHGILIYHNTITSSVKKILELAYDVKFELFLHSRMQYNVLLHDLVPEHTRIEKSGGVDYSTYPILNYDDAVARFLDFSRGDLIKIIRKDGSIYYRIVK